MGLCKCPKRKVTNLFCFEHRVNVCEHCLVANHAKCIVQSYLQWLQDSDYSSNCRLCNTPLAARETTRLVCYDLFHWACLNERAAQLPRNTAPAGYQCPSCNGPIFPPSNLVGPVASVLREKLTTVNWARAGLGLPLIDEVVSPEPESPNSSDFSDWSSFNATGTPEQGERASASTAPAFYSQVPRPPAPPSRPEQHTVIHVGSSEPLAHASAPRKVYDTRDDDRAPGLHGDYDDDKYRRRPALGWLAQLLRSRDGSRKRPLTLLQRAGLLLLLGLLGFLALLALMSRLGRAAADNDPNLDPLMNPHIRVGPS
ncbi:zinc finger protein-like 1 isoform X1 [Pteronotus mesoamericanus]|uniref:zinc finger protein-like 1 isoform X1 n=1 Tax=Pteronotus mesoamericanus TaxID=1884717 RepID=UPI0023EB053C|nr:zinc finger protein-like 1 isoform X1 [Pteronotus parnellii mesoamericanus]XP_054426591.1 zinc finger protein-like 1 isoform X1 [Pteronotus parnellii mesoamericanus]